MEKRVNLISNFINKTTSISGVKNVHFAESATSF